jgi:hypothetical protein
LQGYSSASRRTDSLPNIFAGASVCRFIPNTLIYPRPAVCLKLSEAAVSQRPPSANPKSGICSTQKTTYAEPKEFDCALEMAANFWESTQRRHWQFTREQLEDLRKKLEDEELVQMYPLPALRHLSIYFNQRKPPLDYRTPLLTSSPLQKLHDLENALVYDSKLWQQHSYTFVVSIQRSKSDAQIRTW